MHINSEGWVVKMIFIEAEVCIFMRIFKSHFNMHRQIRHAYVKTLLFQQAQHSLDQWCEFEVGLCLCLSYIMVDWNVPETCLETDNIFGDARGKEHLSFYPLYFYHHLKYVLQSLKVLKYIIRHNCCSANNCWRLKLAIIKVQAAENYKAILCIESSCYEIIVIDTYENCADGGESQNKFTKVTNM